MKKLLCLTALCCAVLLTLCACGDKTAVGTQPAETTAQETAADASAYATEAAGIIETEAATAADDKEDAAPQGADEQSDAENDLIGRWNLTAVDKDGEEQSIGVIYGSVIRQTGAYIELNSDGTFNCVLGLVGCTGDYTVENGELTLHATTEYDGKSDDGKSCDEQIPVTLDRENNTLTFDFNNVTNTFTK